MKLRLNLNHNESVIVSIALKALQTAMLYLDVKTEDNFISLSDGHKCYLYMKAMIAKVINFEK